MNVTYSNIMEPRVLWQDFLYVRFSGNGFLLPPTDVFHQYATHFPATPLLST